MVTKIIGDSCTLQKIAKTQFRSKPYQLKLTEIFPVTSELPTSTSANFPIDDDSDSDSEQLPSTEVLHDSPATLDNLGSLMDPVPSSTSEPSTSEPCGVSNEPCEPVNLGSVILDSQPSNSEFDDTTSPGVRSPILGTRRSARTSKKPSWMNSGDFVLEKK